MRASMGAATRIVSVVLAMLLAVTMVPAAGLQVAYADEPADRPATSGGDVALASANGAAVAGTEVADGGLLYTVADGAATLVGFEDGAALEGALVVPETVGDGSGTATVKAVEIAEGQVAEGVTSLALPQAVENVRTEGLAAAFPALASIEVTSNTTAEGDGNEAAAPEGGATAKGAYSSVAGMLFRSAEGQASSDGTAFAEDALELVWAPPAMVVARVPLECKAIAAGAFVDAAALETVMSFGKMESIAAAEKDDEGNVTKPGAFTDEQIGRLTIVVPGTNYAVTGEGAERVSGSVALSEKTDMLEKRKTWFHYGFDTDQIIMGAPFGEIEGVIGVDDEGKAEDRSLITPLQNGKGHLDLTPEEQAEVDARKAAEPKDGLSFSYQASMDLSVKWAGDKTATPAHVEIPAYVAIDDVTYQVTQIEPNAFEGAVFLSNVTIPEGVTAIGESAFAGCTNLKSVSLPSTLKTIDYAAFKGTALESVTTPEGATYIGGEAFADCASLEDARVGTSTLVGTDAFANSPAGAYVLSAVQQSAPSGELQETETSVDADTPAEASDGISAYAAPPGPSELNNTFYTSVPADGVGEADWFCLRALTSPYYTLYHYDIRHGSGWINDHGFADAESVVTPQNLYATNMEQKSHGYNNDMQDPSEATRFVTVNGKRCLQYQKTRANGARPNDVEWAEVGFVAVPADGVALESFRGHVYKDGGPYDYPGGFDTDYLAVGWLGAGYHYVTFGPEKNQLEVTSEDGLVCHFEDVSGANLGNSAIGVAGQTYRVIPPSGYTIDGAPTVDGRGSTWNAESQLLEMGVGPTTVSVKLIPNDIKVTFNLPHAYVAGKTAGAAYGDDNVVWGEGDDANTMTIKTEATVGNTNGTTPMPNTTTISASGSQVAFKNGQGQAGYRVTITPHNGWQHLGMWALSYKDGENWVDDPSFTSMQSAVIDYTKEWRLTPIVTGVTYTITYDGNGSGNPVAGGSYQVGNGLATMPTPKRSGFWFAGWAWTNDQDKMITDPTDTNGFKGDSWYPGDDVDPDVPSFTISDSAYGNAELKAIWKPKTYKIRYDVSVTEKDDGTYWADTPDDDVFVHPDARTVVASASNPGSDSETWAFTKSPEDFRTQDGIDTSALFADGSYDEGAVNYELPKVPFEGYLYKGWTKQVKLPAGLSVSDPNDGPFLAFSADVAGKLWPNQWNLGDTEPEGTYVESTNLITLYGVWLRKGVVTVNLESSDPAEVAAGSVNDEASVKVNGANVENTHVQPIAYWQDRGLMLYREMGEPGHSITGLHDPISSDTKIADTRVVNSATKNRDFQAPTRTGFRFLGWGKAGASGGDDVLYIKYFENAEGAGDAAAGGAAGSHEQGFYLTPAGMERVLRWDTNGGDTVADEGQQETWDALWEIRTYEIELHVPASTVKNTNGNGWSEASYRWEQDVVTRPDGSSTVSSWRKAVKEWKYWDVFYVPYYDLNSPFNAYRGWFRGSIGDAGQFEFTDNDTFTTEDGQVHRKPVITEAQGRAQGQAADAGNTFRVTAANLDPKKLWAGAAAGQETDLDNVTAPDGTIELWLYTEPVYINVTAPMGVFLANDEPYVVGSDPRMALEEEATFTVKESNQDLVLTSITATDIVEADVNQTTNQVDVKTTVDDTKSRETGMCYRMFDVKNDVATDPAGGDQTKWNLDNARIFWVSPSETVYPYVKSTNQDPGQHDMGKRVYFGFGGGKGAANHLGDNVVEDDPDRSDDGNLLGAFELKQNYTAGGLAGKDGYKVSTDAEGTSYVYDATKDQYGKTVGTGEEAHTVWYTWAAKPGDANGRLVLTPVGGGEEAHTVDVSAPLVWRDYSFWYGLDLDKCSFDLGAIQSMVEAEDAWGYNVDYKRPLVKLMFTFAVERVPNVSYGAVGLSGYGAGGGEADAGAAASLATRAGTAGGDIDAEAIVSVGPATAA